MPLRDAVEYVAAAYIVVFALVLIYLTIMSRRLRGVERDLSELTSLADERLRGEAPSGGEGQDDTGDSALRRSDDGRERGEASRSATPPKNPSNLDVGRPESTIA